MRAWLVVCAALALAPCPCRAAAAHRPPPPDTARLERIKSHILAKLGLSSRPTPMGAPPRDVVRQILARASDPQPHNEDREEEQAMREVIAIARRDIKKETEVPARGNILQEDTLFFKSR